MENMLFSVEETGGISLEDVFEAYMDCRKHKRNTYNAIAFEADYERKCIELWHSINSGTYHPVRSIAFIVTNPVRREVFAADFQDRVVHHLIAKRIEPLFEQRFIDDAYSTRKGKGTLYGIKRIEKFMYICSEGYTADCYVMKIDIQSFFMSIPKSILYDKVENFLLKNYHGDDLAILLYMIRETIFNRPEKNCIRRSPRSLWKGLPHSKSLFFTDGMHGLPIGNLTSQLLAQFYLDELDHLVKEDWGIEFYGRYVDDMVLIHKSKSHLLETRARIDKWLSENGLRLHPRKMYLQHYSKGVLFIGGMILPHRKYVSRRVVASCNRALDEWNRKAEKCPESSLDNIEDFVSSMNSYLGMMRYFSTYHIRRRVMENISPIWWKWIYVSGHIEKIVVKKRFSPLGQILDNINDYD